MGEGGRIALPELVWYGGGTTEIRPPDDWRVEVHHMRGARKPPLTGEDIARAIEEPVGTPPLRVLARGRRKAVVLFDDLTRPTRVDQIAPYVVDALLSAGLTEDRISFVCALGAHGALTQNDLRKKVGAGILERFRVYNHNPHDHCVDVGTTSRGTRVWINREVMAADLKIGIGCVTAHPNAGFSGGGKIILPGVARMDTIADHHTRVMALSKGTTGFGKHEENGLRLDIDEAARLAGLDFKIDVVFNENAVASRIFAGAFGASHLQAVAAARKTYTLTRTGQKDLVIVNAVAKPNEILVAYLTGRNALAPRRRGTVVVVANAPEGQVVHYLLGRWGQDYGGLRYPPGRVTEGIRLVVQAPHYDKTFGDWFGNPDAITWTRDWEGTLAVLRPWHGPGTEVAVIPAADMTWYPT